MNASDRVVYLETASLQAPGHDRGLGRYTRMLQAGYAKLGIKVVPVPQKNLFTAGRNGRLLRGKPVHVTAPQYLPFIKAQPWICSIQDTIPLDLHDYSRLGIKSRLAFRNAARSDIVIANSEHTARRIVAHLKIPSSSVPVVPLPLSDAFIESTPTRYHDRDDYVATLVDLRTFDPRKRFHWLGSIAPRLEEVGLPLIVAGRGLDRLHTVAPGVKAVEAPSDSDLKRLIGDAKAFLYTSAYEGQGLPPLEAMALGTPVLGFRNTSITEMVGSGGTLLPDPIPWQRQQLGLPLDSANVEEVVDALQRLVTYPDWLEASEFARARALDFTMENFVGKLSVAVTGVLT